MISPRKSLTVARSNAKAKDTRRQPGNSIPVAIDNDPLGLIVSGDDKEEKNVEEKLKKGQNSLFSLLGPAFAYKCLLSPSLQCHL